MKKLTILLLAFVLVGTLLPSCKSKVNEEKEAQTAAESFMKALASEDFAKAKALGTAASQNVINGIEAMSTSGLMPDSLKAEADALRAEAVKAKINFKQSTINGNDATLSYTVGDNPSEEKVYLQKVGEKWLVDMRMDQEPAAN